MIVVDASAWVVALVDSGRTGERVRATLSADPDWMVPAHAPLEVLRTLRRFETAGSVTSDQAEGLAQAVWSAEVRYVGVEPWLLQTAWRLRENVSAYDAPYLAVATAHGVPLVTLDERLARAARALGVDVLVPA